MDKSKTKKTESFASIFGDDYSASPPDKKEGAIELKLEQLVPFQNHPFKLYEGERFNEMIESIKNYGVIVPIVVRKKGLKYEILSGHNRANAAKEAGLETIPTVIKEGLTEEEAILIVTETNLMQRSFTDLVHSERATVIATRHNAMKNQGVRTDLLNEIERLSKASSGLISTSRPMGEKLKSDENLAKEFGVSPRNVSRYLRIYKLKDPLKQLVDEGKIAMRAGVDLSYLSAENQEMIEAIVSEDTFKVDMKKASIIRNYEEEGKLNWKTAKSIITGEALRDPNKQKLVKIQPKIISKYFSPSQEIKTIEKIIEKALEMYFQKQQESINLCEEEEGDEIGG
ncbi:Plasmid partitioning protein ParB [Petrocella atlantisensis]|uniref:Plasmid partitioning protein ParB n=1 Tax=Petrocella atlantisensis TaxID=2173034 RepID=A0A3P7NWK8_9FIRM|nr:ParB N-terminal domain-containing protein [Petrocella atlantisensis]VDN47325.1 Plasmid partitioning protein ParB [Petrocella atlantisensis]